MSLETWEKEFYPKPAEETTKRSALAHSLRKWRGLTKENLEKHGCVFEYGEVRSEGDYREWYLSISASSCALCHHHYDRERELYYTPPCATCPLAKALGTADGRDEGCSSPWRAWALNGDPKPMIAALEKAIGEKAIEEKRGKP